MMQRQTLVLSFHLLLPLLMVTCRVTAQQENLVRNPGFEAVDEAGALVSWPTRSSVYGVSKEVARSGERSLRWSNDDPKRYVLFSQDVSVEQGHMYAFEVWVKTRDLTGAGSGATICMEWMTQDGTFLAGSYPAGVKGTSDGWQRVHGITRRIPDDAASCHVVCYVRKGGVGTAFFDDVRVWEHIPPLLGTMVTDCYRDKAKAHPFKVFAGLNLVGRDLRPDQVSVDLRMLDEAKKVVARPSELVIRDDRLSATFDGAGLAPGDYTIACEARTTDGKQTGSATCGVTIVDTLPPRKAYIDEHGRLILNGKPFFPLGTYWGGITDRQLDIYAKSRFNCMMPYHMVERDTLDKVHDRGIKVIYSVKDLYAGRRGLTSDEEAQKEITERVTALKDHPAIMAWYINDEMPVSRLPELTAHRDLLEALDPGRPTWVVLYQVGQVRQYLPTFDVIGTDPYPVPTKPVSTALRYTRLTREAVFGARAVWMVPQIFNWASYRKTPEEKKKMRAPTFPEMRSMAWQCIAGGANGLVFYSWMDLWRMDKTVDDPGGRALVREPFETRWADVTRMAAEISRLSPVLLSVDPSADVVRKAGDECVAFRLYGRKGRTYVVAVNSDTDRASLTLTCEKDIHDVSMDLGQSTPAASGRDLVMRFDPLEVKVVSFSSP